MITTKQALDALKNAGLIQSWRWVIEGEGDCKETIPYVKSTHLVVSDETYGKDSFLYFTCKSQAAADKAAEVLHREGGDPNFNWTPNNPKAFDLQVAYFKGARHWE